MSNDVSLDINHESNPVRTVAPPEEDNNMLRATNKITALYCRLAVEDTREKDGKDDPSNSIRHQQIMLMEYAKSQHFSNPTFFIDEGYSGVDFSNRPGFQKMFAEIEAGRLHDERFAMMSKNYTEEQHPHGADPLCPQRVRQGALYRCT